MPMFPLNFKEFLSNLSKSQMRSILFFSCISFEPRCIKSTRILNKYKNVLDIRWVFFQIKDNGSYYEKECLKKQKKNKNIIKRILDKKIKIPLFDMFNSTKTAEENIISLFKNELKKNQDIQFIIIDITTFPKKIYIPFIKWILEEKSDEYDILISYTKPKEYYSEELEMEPMKPETLIGTYRRINDLIWIPSLGFKSEFTKKIWEVIKNIKTPSEITKKEINPILAFPAYRQDFYDKSLLKHAKAFDKNELFLHSLKNKVIFTSADDPFEIYQKLKKFYTSYNDKEIILSPGGPKPISLGMTLFAIQYDLPVISVQAKTYHPEYSKGAGDINIYWLIRNSKYTYYC